MHKVGDLFITKLHVHWKCSKVLGEYEINNYDIPKGTIFEIVKAYAEYSYTCWLPQLKLFTKGLAMDTSIFEPCLKR